MGGVAVDRVLVVVGLKEERARSERPGRGAAAAAQGGGGREERR